MTVKWNIQAARFFIPAVDGELTTEQVIEISDEQYAELKVGVAAGKEIYISAGTLALRDNSMVYPAEYYMQQEANIEAITKLNTTDWKVIRELERLYLAGTPLNVEREAARTAVAVLTPPVQE